MKAAGKILKKDEVLFREGESATSLFIIQKGQLRLFKEQGDNTVDLAVLRKGEVLGEMSYFEEGQKARNCSAMALIDTEYVEVPFDKFSKIMEGLNPWFQTIIKTLVDRLKKANARIKSLEGNLYSGNSQGNRKFSNVKVIDLAKSLSMIYLCFKGHASRSEDCYALKKKTLLLYATEVFNINDSKLEQVLIALKENDLIEEEGDKDLVLKTHYLEQIKEVFVLFNSERYLVDDKKLRVSSKCLKFLKEIGSALADSPSTDEFIFVPVKSILEKLKSEDAAISLDDLVDAKEIGIVKSVLVDSGEYSLPVSKVLLDKYLNFLSVKDHFYQ